ncbi:MAG: ABC transporter ATP-binding protein, partial [Bifidobacteriaceae bacterium]|nr:ABC transporter ATP-binding protein [Bifidobacteriaceae bacterium]
DSVPAVKVSGLTVRYGNREVLQGLDLVVNRGESVALMGSSGCGKSTLLSVILGLLKPLAGKLLIGGHPMKAGLSRSSTALRREMIGAVFQDGELVNELTALENIELAGLLAGMRGNAAIQRAQLLLEQFGLPNAQRPVTQMSGGERQRVAVARALVTDPWLVVADEPTGSLDPANRDEVVKALFAIPHNSGCAVIAVTHDPHVAKHADRIYELANGKLSPVQHAAETEAVGRPE